MTAQTRRRLLKVSVDNLDRAIKELKRYHLFYKSVDEGKRDDTWSKHKDDERRVKDSITGLESRMSHRGRSQSGAEILLGLLGAVAMTFLVTYRDSPELIKPVIWGFMGMLLALLPLPKEILPRRVDDEFIEVLERDTRGWLGETSSRSMMQRAKLRRLRVARLSLTIGLFIALANLLQGYE